ncbi:MAG: serine hydrolase domain-containing protein [Aestuariibacter sp.]
MMSLGKNRVFMLGCCLSFLLMGCGGGETSQTPPPPPELTDSYDDIAGLLDHYNVPGVSIVTIKNFQLDRIIAVGVKDQESNMAVTPDTMFQAASISKSLVAVAVMKAMQNGELFLDTDISDMLTSWQLPDSSFSEDNTVTLRGLIAHTAGINVHGFGGYKRSGELPTTVQVLDGQSPANSEAVKVVYTPGSKFQYSGGGYTLMQLALADYYQQPFDEWMRDQVLSPLAMTNSTYQQPLPSTLIENTSSGHYSNGNKVDGGFHVYPEMAAAGLWTTAEDLAKYTIEMQNSLNGNANNLLASEQLYEMLNAGPNPDFGLGFELFRADNYGYFGHSGANEGFRAVMFAHKTDGVGLVLMANSDNGIELFEEVVRLVARLEGWPGF